MSSKKFGLNSASVGKDTRLYYFRKDHKFIELDQGLSGNMAILKEQFDLGCREGIFCTFPHTKIIHSNGDFGKFSAKVRNWMTTNGCYGVLKDNN